MITPPTLTNWKEAYRNMDIMQIFEKYYYTDSNTFRFLMTHSRCVAEKALRGAEKVKHLNPNLQFIEDAALMHDIGIFKVHAPNIGCIGPTEYVAHGYLGRELLDKEGLPAHGLVCERHVGAGITIKDIRRFHLPLPERDMVPLTVEEKLICWADKFYSKWPASITEEKSLDKTRVLVAKYGDESLARFDEWQELFG